MTLLSCWAALAGGCGALVIVRMLRGVHTTSIRPSDEAPPAGSISVIVPVLDEARRIAPCLQGLLAAGSEVGEFLVVDGGSRDATASVVRELIRDEPRARLIDAAPVPAGWNGKAWGLEVGRRAVAARADWVATIDADVRPKAGLFAAMLAHAERRGVGALSVATRQELADAWQAIVHPAMLASLVYRYGLPGREAHRVSEVQANGQCFLVRRSVLDERGFEVARDSRCEDVTLARALVANGVAVGFYEAGDLVSVRMHESWRETWAQWPRSLTLRDRFAGWRGWYGLFEVLLVQASPLPVAVGLALAGATANPAFTVALALLAVRGGVLAGAARAYVRRPPSYWLAPLADLPVAVLLFVAALRHRHVWRGRPLVLGEA